ncbi:MAG: hypothetical protein Q9P14_02225 [candidate division KSB1 bacterium]|nr:hypothetical protein [candidate division KSB1 bacterium]
MERASRRFPTTNGSGFHFKKLCNNPHQIKKIDRARQCPDLLSIVTLYASAVPESGQDIISAEKM